jgi:homocysteine S-methyltransferase
MSSKFIDRLDNEPKPLVTDGALGTILHDRGISFDTCFDCLNVKSPATVAEILSEYIHAGAELIKTNTFGANAVKLSKFNLEKHCAEFNRSAVALAQRVVQGSFKDVMIAGDVGPLGVPLAPFGRLQPEEARAIYREQIEALLTEGVDVLLMETMVDLKVMAEAVGAARELNPKMPIIASMTFSRDKRTMLGDTPLEVANFLTDLGCDVIGVNCSGGPVQLLSILKIMRHAQPDARISVMPNAGFPEQVGGRIMYPAVASYFTEFALAFWKAGARVIGGCCGTTPEHIKAIAEAIQSHDLEEELHDIQVQSYVPMEMYSEPPEQTRMQKKLSEGKFVSAVEMDPPRGFSTHKLMAGASLLADAGADCIDVADSPMARMRMSPWGVCQMIQNELNVDATLHFPTRGRNLLRVQGDLLAAHALGIRNVFVVMGDPTAIGDYPDAMDNYDLVPTGLIKLIKQGLNAGVDHSGTKIGTPTSFFVGAAVDLTPASLERELKLARKKIVAGADFFLSQPVFDPELARIFIKRYEDQYGELETPILAGLLPLASARHAKFLHNEVPGISIPDPIHERLRKAGENGAHVGVKIAEELVDEIRGFAQGIYIMPQFNRFDLVAEIIADLNSKSIE